MSELPVRQVVGLMNKTNHGVGRHLGRGAFDVGLIARIGELSNGFSLWVISFPGWNAALTQEIILVEQQLFQAGPSHTDQFEFGFLGGAGGHGALGDVLFAGIQLI